MRRPRSVRSRYVPVRPARPAEPVDVAKSIAAIVALTDDAWRNLQRLRDRLAQLPEPARTAAPLTEDWRIVEHGLFGPAGILGVIVAAHEAAAATQSTSDRGLADSTSDKVPGTTAEAA
jgi:hypothetical protein